MSGLKPGSRAKIKAALQENKDLKAEVLLLQRSNARLQQVIQELQYDRMKRGKD